MSREIKFKRYYDNGDKPITLTLDEIEEEVYDDYWQPYAYLSQYTGLKDKNGVEIYEGDIAKFRTTRLHNKRRTKNEKPRSKWFKSVVEWEDCSFVISESQPRDSVLWTHGNALEVIGNIHENPELLEQPNAQ